MAADIKRYFVQMRKDIKSLAKEYPDCRDLIKKEIRSLNWLPLPVVKPSGLEQSGNVKKSNRPYGKALVKRKALSRGVTATDVDKTVLPQSAVTDTVDETISTDRGLHSTVKGDGVNAIEDSLRGGDAELEGVSLGAKPILQEAMEIRERDQERQQSGPEDNQTTEEHARGRSLPVLTRLNVSTDGSNEQPISLLNCSSPATPQWTVWDNESEMLIHNWLHQTDLSDLLQTARQLPGTASFKLPKRPRFELTEIGKELVLTILTSLQKGKRLLDETVNYFSSRMVVEAGVQLLDSFWYPRSLSNLGEAAGQLDLLPGTLTLIPCCSGKHWSCIEVDQEEGTITHYDSLHGTHCGGAGTGCSHCKRVGDTFSYALKNLAPDSWEFRTPHCPQQANGKDCGIFMLAFLGRRAQKLDLDQDLDPGQYRFNMAIRFIQDILAGKSARDILQAMSSDTKMVPFELVEEPANSDDEDATPQNTDEEERWGQFEATYQSIGWISQLRRIAGEPQFDILGFRASSRFLQLVANIASPLTLVQVKQQLAELRRHQPKPTVSPNHLQGAYAAGVWHNGSTLRSSMCLRLISWVFRNEVWQRMKGERRPLRKQKAGKTSTQGNKNGGYQTIKNKVIGDLVKEIGLLGEADNATSCCPPTSVLSVDEIRTTANVGRATENDMKTRIKAWYKTGGSWSRLATAVGSPACLCFLPSGVNIVPGQRPIHASDYRDLSMSQVGFLGTLLSALRPRIDVLFREELYGAFLRNSPPTRRFRIEGWSEDWIRREPLDSDDLAKAFELEPDGD